MLYQLWANFYAFADKQLFGVQVERLAVSDVLLSALWRPTGQGDVYEMEAETRGAMLDWLRADPRFGEVRLRALAEFTAQYASLCLVETGQESLRETLTWGALATLQPSVALSALRDRISGSLSAGQFSEVMRMRDLAEAFAHQERRPIERDFSSFGSVLQYTVALKAGMNNLPSHVQQKLVNSSMQLSKEKPETGLAFPFPTEMIDNQLFETLPNTDVPLEIRQILNGMIVPDEGIEYFSLGVALQNYFHKSKDAHFLSQVFDKSKATKDSVTQFIQSTSASAKPGDTVLLVFAGSSGVYQTNSIYGDPFSQSNMQQQNQMYSQNTGSPFDDEIRQGEVYLRMSDTDADGKNGLTYRQLSRFGMAYYPAVNFVLCGMPPNFLGSELMLPNVVFWQSHPEVATYSASNIEGKRHYLHTFALTKTLTEAPTSLTYEQINNATIEIISANELRAEPSLVSLRPQNKSDFATKQLATDVDAIYYARAILALEVMSPKDAKRHLLNARFAATSTVDTQTELQLVRQLFAKAGEKSAAIYARGIAFASASEQVKSQKINQLVSDIDDYLSRPDELTYEIEYDADALAVLKILPPPLGMIRIAGGSYPMGDVFGEGNENEKNIREVVINDIEMGRFAVTFEEFDVFCESTEHPKPPDEGWGRGRRPVIHVSWNDAVTYCNWRSITEGLQAVYSPRKEDSQMTADYNQNGYRLPTEAEWEFAARERGKKLRFGNGKEIADAEQMNFNAQETKQQSFSVVGQFRNQSLPVGTFPPNGLGLYDMSGNVFEWCDDKYREKDANKDPFAPEYAFRGGSWFSNPEFCRTTFRGKNVPTTKYNFIGFRLAKKPI